MSAHMCREITPGCYRCELAKDEMAAIEAEDRADAQEAWIAYRDNEIRSKPWADARRVVRQLRRGSFVAGFIAGRKG